MIRKAIGISIMALSPSCICPDVGWVFVVTGELVDAETGGSFKGAHVSLRVFQNEVEVSGGGGGYVLDDGPFSFGVSKFPATDCTLIPFTPFVQVVDVDCPTVDRIELTVRRLDDGLRSYCREDVFQIELSGGVLTRENECQATFRLNDPIRIEPCPN